MKIKEKALLFLILGIIAFIANSAIWINYTSYDEDGWAKAMPNVLANPILLVSSFITFLLLSEAFFWFLVKNDCDDVGSSKFTAILFAFMVILIDDMLIPLVVHFLVSIALCLIGAVVFVGFYKLNVWWGEKSIKEEIKAGRRKVK